MKLTSVGDTPFLGDVFLRHAMQAIHLEGVTGALGQLAEGLGDVLEGGEVDVGGFGRGVLQDDVQAFFFTAGILLLHGLLAVVIDGQVAHDLEQVAELGLERRGDLRRGAESEEGILHHIFGA